MTKKELAVEIAIQLFMDENISEDNWYVKVLMKKKKHILLDLHELAEKVRESLIT